MQFRLIAVLFLIVILFSACSSGAETAVSDMPELPVTTLTVNAKISTERPEPTSTSQPTLTATATPEPEPTLEPTAAQIFQLCSPLAEQSLAELSEIVSDPYKPPPPGKEDRHHGVDFSYYRRKDRTTIAGEIVQAILPGKVVAVVEDRLPYGNMVIIETVANDIPPKLAAEIGWVTGESLYHLYAHFGRTPQVSLGEWVACGQPLGEVGLTGYNIVNPHLHLETRLGPAGADFTQGLVYYSTSSTAEERSNYELWRTSGVFRHFDPMDLVVWFLENPFGK